MLECVTLQRDNGFGFSITGGHPADVVISKMKPGSPAEKCGKLSVGDRIISLNGQAVAGLSQTKVVDLVRRAGQTLEVEFKRVAGTRTDFSKVPASSDRTRRADSLPRSQSKEAVPAAKPAVSSKPKTAPKPAPKPKPTPAAKPGSGEIPAEAQAQLSTLLERVTASASKLGLSVSASSSLPFEERLQTAVEQLEAALDGDGLAMTQLAAVVDRIEAAATKWPASSAPAPTPAGDVHARLGSVVARLESASSALTDSSSGGAGGVSAPQHETAVPTAGSGADLQFGRTTLSASGEAEADYPAVAAYDTLLQTRLRPFLNLCNDVGGDVEEQADLVKMAFIAQRRLLSVVPAASKPGPKVLPQLLEATQDAVAAVIKFREACGGGPLANHLAAVAEGITALSWITMEPKPAPFVRDMADAAQFYTNRVIKEYKETDKMHCEWARAFMALLADLAAYVKEHHTTGLAWGKKMRSMTFWSNAIAQTAPGEGDADCYIFNTKLGVPTTN